MKEFELKGNAEAAVALAMFTDNPEERKQLLKKAADAGNSEGLWGDCMLLPHSFISNPSKKEDALWEEYCLKVAESGVSMQ